MDRKQIDKFIRTIEGHICGSAGSILGMINDGDVIIDIGANFGSFCKHINKIKKDCKYYLFEPVRSCFEYMKENYSGLTNFNLYNYGCTNCNDDDPTKYKVMEKNIFCGQKNLGWNTLVEKMVDADNRDTPEIATFVGFDDFNEAELKLPAIDFIKIDVEGYEYKVLEGMFETIKAFKPVIFCEIGWGKDRHPEWAREKKAFENLFGMGYRRHDLDKITTTRDILLVAG